MKSRISALTPASAKAVAPLAALRATRGDGELSRERLMLAGLKLFAEQGYAKTSIRQITLAARANVAAVSYYFGDKAGLYRAVYGGLPQAPAAKTASISARPRSAATSLASLFAQFLEPLKCGEQVRLWMKLHRREMLEPTGLWKEKIDSGVRPMHASLVTILCERFGLARADDEVHRLAISIAGLAMHLYVGCDVVETLAPQLSARPGAFDLWRERLLDYAEAMIAAERRRRARVAPVKRAARRGTAVATATTPAPAPRRAMAAAKPRGRN